jgi:hypothetical protein
LADARAKRSGLFLPNDGIVRKRLAEPRCDERLDSEISDGHRRTIGFDERAGTVSTNLTREAGALLHGGDRNLTLSLPRPYRHDVAATAPPVR